MIGVANQKVDEFIEKNTDIIDRDDVKGVLEKAKKQLNEKELIYLFCVFRFLESFKEGIKEEGFEFEEIKNNISFTNLEVCYNKLKVDINIKNINSLVTLKKLILKYNSNIYVNYKYNKIAILLTSKRDCDIWASDKQKKLFKKYSKITLKKAINGDFKDFIHFVEYHTIKKICIKPKKEMYDFRIEQYIKEKGDNAKKDYEPHELSLLGCFVYDSSEIWLCDELIEKTAKELAEEFSVKLFGDNSLPYDAIESLLYEKVFTHEFGHLVFEWTNAKCREVQEKQANYFSSYITDEKINGFILYFTSRQPKEYHNPYLKGDTRADNLYQGIL